MEIKEPWCVYGFHPNGIGKVVLDSPPTSVEILYNEKQKFPPQLWDTKYIRRFETPTSALEYLANYLSRPLEELRSDLEFNFPSIKK
ncbi:MAG: hypothetical protein WCK90_03115 [archaeon]